MQPQERLAWHQPAFAFEASQDQYEVLLVFVPPFEQTNFLLAGGGIKQMMLTVLISTCNRPASSNDELGHSIYIYLRYTYCCTVYLPRTHMHVTREVQGQTLLDCNCCPIY